MRAGQRKKSESFVVNSGKFLLQEHRFVTSRASKRLYWFTAYCDSPEKSLCLSIKPGLPLDRVVLRVFEDYAGQIESSDEFRGSWYLVG